MLLQEMIKEERKEAYAEGRVKERIYLAKKFLANGTDPKLVATSLDMTLEEFENWMKEESLVD